MATSARGREPAPPSTTADRTVLALRRDDGDGLGERAALARHLGKAPAQRPWEARDVEAHDDVAGGQAWSRRRPCTKSSMLCTRTPFRADHAQACVEREQAGRPVGGGIGQRHAAADGAVVAHRAIGNLPGDPPHQAVEDVRHLAVLDRGVGGQRAEPEAVGRVGDDLQIVEPADVDQQVGKRDAERQHRHQRLAAGDRRGRRAAAAERDARFGHRLRPDIVERRRLHGRPPMFSGSLSRRARSTASETRRGVSGVSLKLAPMLRKASADRIGDRRGRRDRAAFAEALDAVFGGERGRHHMRDAHRGNFRRARHHVVGERGGERLALLVVGDFLVKRGADALGDAALHLAVDDHRIDHGAAVLGHRVVENLDRAGVGLDRDHDGMGAVGEHAAGFRRLVGRGGVEQRVHAGRQMLLAHVGGIGDLGEADAAARAMHGARLQTRVGDVGLQQVRADPPDLFGEHAAGARDRAAGKHDGARGEGAEAERRGRGVAVAHRDLRRDRSSAHAPRSATASSRGPGRGSARRHGASASRRAASAHWPIHSPARRATCA